MKEFQPTRDHPNKDECNKLVPYRTTEENHCYIKWYTASRGMSMTSLVDIALEAYFKKINLARGGK